MSRQVALYRYRLPLGAGVALCRQAQVWREGLIVHLAEGARQGWGEVAPLPGFSRETLAAASAATRDWLLAWQAGDTGQTPPWPDLPAAAFGLSCAHAELHGELPAAGDYRPLPLCTGEPAVLAAIYATLPAGKIVKLKVGLGVPADEGKAIAALLDALPGLSLRLDANRAWSLAEAQSFVAAIPLPQRRRIEFFEEPCRTPAESLRFAADAALGLPLAWDESLREAGFILAARPGLRAIVIKPSLLGSIDRCRRLVAEAEAAGLAAVISSSVESSLGLTQLARLSAWLTPQNIPGLDTLGMMPAQVLRRWPGADLPLLTVADLECLTI